MKCGFLVNAIGCIDGAFIDEAENYKPKRRMPVWIWAAASAACLCVVVLFGARLTERPCEHVLRVVVGANAENGYVNYRERAEMGKVLITDELLSLMDKNKDTRCTKAEYSVRITDANGAAVPFDCLPSTKKLSGDERVKFAQKGIVDLSRKEIYAVKASPDLALIISPVYLGIDEKYLNTVGRDSLDVWVSIEFDKEFLEEYEYMDEYDRLDSETRYKRIEEQVTRFFKEKHHVHIELDDEFKQFLEEYDSLDSEKRHRNFVKQISRLLYLKYVEYDIDGDPIKGYGGGNIDLDSEFEVFLHKERIYKYLAKYAEGYGIDIDSIKEYKEVGPGIAFNAELGTELIARLLQDARTRGVCVTDIL